MTIHPNFTWTVPNCDGQSWENYEVFWDAELSQILNPVPILSRFECIATSHDVVDHVMLMFLLNTYTKFVVVRCILSSWKCTTSIFSWCSTRTPLGELTLLPQAPCGLGRGPSPIPLPFNRCLILIAFSTLNSVPIFCCRFMVTLYI